MNDSRDFLGNGGLRIAGIGTLAILALFLLVETISIAENIGRPTNQATDTITVTGSGQASLAPDVAHVTFSIENTKPTVGEAQAATTKQAGAALEYARGQGIAEKDIRTVSYNISPQYAYPRPCPVGVLCPAEGAPTIIGYQVSETIQLTVRNLDKTGAVLGGLGSLGVQNVSGPDLALDDPTAGYTAARADAIAKAKTQAKVLAEQLGVRLGRIVNFSESGNGYPVVYSMGISAKDSAAPNPQVPIGQNDYTTSVSITYEIR